MGDIGRIKEKLSAKQISECQYNRQARYAIREYLYATVTQLPRERAGLSALGLPTHATVVLMDGFSEGEWNQYSGTVTLE